MGAQAAFEGARVLLSSLAIDKCADWKEETQIGPKRTAVPRENAGSIFTSNDPEDEGSVMATEIVFKVDAVLQRKGIVELALTPTCTMNALPTNEF